MRSKIKDHSFSNVFPNFSLDNSELDIERRKLFTRVAGAYSQSRLKYVGSFAFLWPQEYSELKNLPGPFYDM